MPSYVTCNNQQHIHFTGHSWIAGQAGGPGRGPLTEAPGGFRDLYRAVPYSSVGTAPSWRAPNLGDAKTANTTPATLTGRRDNLTFYGIGGATSGTYIDPTNYVLQTKSYRPDILVWLTGVNDWSGGVDVTPGGIFDTNTETYLSTFQADFPASQVIVCSVTPRNEQYTLVGPHFLDGGDTWPGNDRLRERAQLHGYVYADIINPLLQLEIANNTPSPGALTFYSYDDLHWLEPGKALLGAILMTFFRFV